MAAPSPCACSADLPPSLTPAVVNPAARLAEFAAAIKAGAEPDAETLRYLATGVVRYLDGEPLEDALALTGAPGTETPRTCYRRAMRNAYLRAASAELPPGAANPARLLATAVRHFESVLWPRWRRLDAPPARASILDRHLFAARHYGELPRTERRLRAICRAENNPPY